MNPSARLSLLVLLASLNLAIAAKDPAVPGKQLDFTAGDALPQSRSHDWTLGPTGARGWFQVSGSGMGTTKTSRQIYITKVARDTPAAPLLKPGDVITGLDGKPFSSDARLAFARAIARAESEGGKLTLTRFRDGRSEQVTLTLPAHPAYSPTAPFACEKSRAILRAGCQALARRGLGNPGIPSHLNALALLSTGDPAYLPLIEGHVKKTLARPLSPATGLPCWHFSFANIFLSEYYLATKDVSVLPEIQRLTTHLVRGQGPLGTWGHSFVDPERNRLQGYGAVNAVGLPVAISLVLARECGIEVAGLDETISKTSSFFRRHVGLGAIPYGDGPPNLQYGHDDNGKNSAAALFFHLLGDKAATRFYTRCALAAHGADREQGHTGNFFNMLWSLPAVALAGPQGTGAWMNEFGWYYDLARDPAYRFPYQGYPRQHENNAYARWECPGAYLLHFALPLKKLRLTGRGSDSPGYLTPAEIKDAVACGNLNYRALSPDQLNSSLSSWSPIVRKQALAELRRRKISPAVSPSLRSDNPLDRIAALQASKNFRACAALLEDPSLPVRVAALKRITALDKEKAFAAIMEHLAESGEKDPVLTQIFANRFFPLSVRAQTVGNLLNSTSDRKTTLRAVRLLLDDEDALVSSRIAMGLKFLPAKELDPLLPTIIEGSRKFPVGNVMFANKFQLSCTEVLVHLQSQEGMEAAADLLTSNAWGRNARLPQAARLLLEYKGHAKSTLPQLRKCLAQHYAKPSQWKTLLEDTIAKIEAAPEPKSPLPTLQN